MTLDHKMFYSGAEYQILAIEQEFIIHPAALGLLPLTSVSLQFPFRSSFHIEDYRLILDSMTVLGSNPVKALGADEESEGGIDYSALHLSYNGAVLIGNKLVKEYYLKSNVPACFSYENVYELIFEDGRLITTVDQSKAMRRIRKNLELGLRTLYKPRDARCILKFINTSLVGDYRPSRFCFRQLNYVKEMQHSYSKLSLTDNRS